MHKLPSPCILSPWSRQGDLHSKIWRELWRIKLSKFRRKKKKPKASCRSITDDSTSKVRVTHTECNIFCLAPLDKDNQERRVDLGWCMSRKTDARKTCASLYSWENEDRSNIDSQGYHMQWVLLHLLGVQNPISVSKRAAKPLVHNSTSQKTSWDPVDGFSKANNNVMSRMTVSLQQKKKKKNLLQRSIRLLLQQEEKESKQASQKRKTETVRERERFGPEGGRARRARNPQDPDTASSCKWRCWGPTTGKSPSP